MSDTCDKCGESDKSLLRIDFRNGVERICYCKDTQSCYRNLCDYGKRTAARFQESHINDDYDSDDYDSDDDDETRFNGKFKYDFSDLVALPQQRDGCKNYKHKNLDLIFKMKLTPGHEWSVVASK